jgi:hypothetical protein
VLCRCYACIACASMHQSCRARHASAAGAGGTRNTRGKALLLLLGLGLLPVTVTRTAHDPRDLKHGPARAVKPGAVTHHRFQRRFTTDTQLPHVQLDAPSTNKRKNALRLGASTAVPQGLQPQRRDAAVVSFPGELSAWLSDAESSLGDAESCSKCVKTLAVLGIAQGTQPQRGNPAVRHPAPVGPQHSHSTAGTSKLLSKLLKRVEAAHAGGAYLPQMK